MNETLLLLVPVAIIFLHICNRNRTFRFFTNIFYYSKFIALFIPFILVYLKPELKEKIMSAFMEIDKKPMYQNMSDLMSSYMDSKKNNNKIYGSPMYQNTRGMNINQYNNKNQYSNQNQNLIPMNNRMNLINPKNMKPGRHKRNVSESKKKYIASQQKWHCAHCSQMLDNTFEVDHVIPLYKGGSNELNNLEALCRNCHGKKTFKDKLGI